jgi:alkylation response protein AidB-like acyl-CoA dehydrogenase
MTAEALRAVTVRGAGRYVVLEEMLAAGHQRAYIAERQSGPLIPLRYGTTADERRSRGRANAMYLHGMSEQFRFRPHATGQATPTADGFRLDGRKAWTSYVRTATFSCCAARADERIVAPA